MEDPLLLAIPLLFPIVFAGLWLGISAIMLRLSGWHRLERRFPDREETPLRSLKHQSGFLGWGISLRSSLRFDTCPSGLRISL